MPVERFFPLVPTATGDWDMLQAQAKEGAALYDPTSGDYGGTRWNGTFDIPQCAWSKFEVTIPPADEINVTGCVVGPRSSGFGNGIIAKFSGGFLSHQASPTASWQLADGVKEWLTDFDMPMASYRTIFGVIQDLTVFHNNAAAFAAVDTPFNNQGGGHYTYGVATADTSPAVSVEAGVLNQFVSFLEDHEVNRGDTVTNSVSMMFHWYIRYGDYVPGANAYRYILDIAEPFGDERSWFLEVEWDYILPVVTITVPPPPVTTLDNVSVEFTGTSTQAPSTDISSGIVWTSDRAPFALGTGATVFSTLSVGFHTITATSTDANGTVGTAVTTITVEASNKGLGLDITLADTTVCVTLGTTEQDVTQGTTEQDVTLADTSSDVTVETATIDVSRETDPTTIIDDTESN